MPKLHVESPTSSSILLASLLLKMGGYGLSRILCGYGWVIVDFLRVFSILGYFFLRAYCCFLRDTKLVVAYSSVVHMRLILVLLLSGRGIGKGAALFLIVSHGLGSVLLFYVVGE